MGLKMISDGGAGGEAVFDLDGKRFSYTIGRRGGFEANRYGAPDMEGLALAKKNVDAALAIYQKQGSARVDANMHAEAHPLTPRCTDSRDALRKFAEDCPKMAEADDAIAAIRRVADSTPDGPKQLKAISAEASKWEAKIRSSSMPDKEKRAALDRIGSFTRVYA